MSSAMLPNMLSSFVSDYATMAYMKKMSPPGKVKYPNNLWKLMQRDNVPVSSICRVWGNIHRGDVSRRINGVISITQPRRDILLREFGWTASDLFEDWDEMKTRALKDVLTHLPKGAAIEILPKKIIITLELI